MAETHVGDRRHARIGIEASVDEQMMRPEHAADLDNLPSLEPPPQPRVVLLLRRLHRLRIARLCRLLRSTTLRQRISSVGLSWGLSGRRRAALAGFVGFVAGFVGFVPIARQLVVVALPVVMLENERRQPVAPERAGPVEGKGLRRTRAAREVVSATAREHAQACTTTRAFVCAAMRLLTHCDRERAHAGAAAAARSTFSYISSVSRKVPESDHLERSFQHDSSSFHAFFCLRGLSTDTQAAVVSSVYGSTNRFQAKSCVRCSTRMCRLAPPPCEVSCWNDSCANKYLSLCREVNSRAAARTSAANVYRPPRPTSCSRSHGESCWPLWLSSPGAAARASSAARCCPWPPPPCKPPPPRTVCASVFCGGRDPAELASVVVDRRHPGGHTVGVPSSRDEGDAAAA